MDTNGQEGNRSGKRDASCQMPLPHWANENLKAIDLDSQSQCPKWEVKCQCSFPLCTVTLDRRQGLGDLCHSSTFDAGLRAEPGCCSTTSLLFYSSCCQMELFSFMKPTEHPPSVQWPSGKGWISGLWSKKCLHFLIIFCTEWQRAIKVWQNSCHLSFSKY